MVRKNLVQTAQDASHLVDADGVVNGRHNAIPNIAGVLRVRPRIYTQASSHSEAPLKPETGRSQEDKNSLSDQQLTSTPKASKAAVDISFPLKELSPAPSIAAQSHQSNSIGRNGPRSVATSPSLRQYAIPVSEGSPMETLPAMQSSSPPHASKSPHAQQSLPSLHAQLGTLVDARSGSENGHRTNGVAHPPWTSFSTPGSVQSPPMNSMPCRPSQFTNLHGHKNGPFQPPYPPTQMSPISTFSESSPREPFRRSQDPTSMSPPGKPDHPQYYHNGPATQSDAQTPLSAESHQSAGSFSTDTSANGDCINVNSGRVILPPLGMNGPLMSGMFRCDHAGCTAPPFQTQYLLKLVEV